MVTSVPVRFTAVILNEEADEVVLAHRFPNALTEVADKVGIAAWVWKFQTEQPVAVDPAFFGTIFQ